MFKSAKKLRFDFADAQKSSSDLFGSSDKDVIPFKIHNELNGDNSNNQAPNNSGNPTNYNHFLTSKNLNNLFETVDEIMTEEDHESKSASIQSSGNHSSNNQNHSNIFQAVHIN